MLAGLAEFDPELAGIPGALFAVIWICVILWFLFWPVFVLIWFSRPSIRAEVQQWT